MLKLSDQIERKFVDIIDISLDGWEIETPSGFEPLTHVNKTVEYDIWIIEFDNGTIIKCADTHIFMSDTNEEIFAQDSLGKSFQSKTGLTKVISVTRTEETDNMYDLTVDTEDHVYYTAGIVSHNTTTVAMLLVWFIIFVPNRLSAIMGNKEKIAIEILSKIQFSYENLPWFLQQGVKIFNRKEIKLENDSRIIAAATSASGLRGFTVTGFLFLDEFAFVDENKADPFWTSVYPTISQPNSNAKLIVSSTPKGYNYFYKLWNSAELKKLPMATLRVYWWEVPGRDDAWAKVERQVLGDLKFAQEVECSFLGSSKTLINPKDIASFSEETPIFTSEDGLSIYKNPEQGRVYFLSCDPSRGVGGDNTSFVILDVTQYPMEVVATYKNNEISPRILPILLNKMGKTYNEAYILVEINDNGQEVANILEQDLEYENILRPEGFHSKLPGLRTTKKTKAIGCSTFKDLVENKKILLKDSYLKIEMQNFVEKGTSFQADSGYTDDMIMCCINFAYITSLPSFEGISDLNFKHEMIKLHEQAVEEDVLPFGFIVNGTESDELYSHEHPQQDVWKIF